MPKNIDLVKTGVVNVFIEFFYSTYEIKQSLKTEKKKLKVIFLWFCVLFASMILLSHSYANMHSRLNN